MLSVLQGLKRKWDLHAAVTSADALAFLPAGWVQDHVLRSTLSENADRQSEFYRQMKSLYACMDRYNDDRKPSHQVHLVLKPETADWLCAKSKSVGDNLGAHIEGFGFFTRGKVYSAYYIDNFEDVGFRVYDVQKSYAYFRTYAGDVAGFGAFIDQVVYRRDENPKLHF